MEDYRRLISLNLDGIESEFINSCLDLETDLYNNFIDKRFSKETIDSFNKRQINPGNINQIIEFAIYLQIVNIEIFVLRYAEPSDCYQINQEYLKKLNFPIFISNYRNIPKTIFTIIEYGLFEWLKFAHENGCPWGNSVCSWAATGKTSIVLNIR